MRTEPSNMKPTRSEFLQFETAENILHIFRLVFMHFSCLRISVPNKNLDISMPHSVGWIFSELQPANGMNPENGEWAVSTLTYFAFGCMDFIHLERI